MELLFGGGPSELAIKLGLHSWAEFQNLLINEDLLFDLDDDWILSYFDLQVKLDLRELRQDEMHFSPKCISNLSSLS